MAAESLNEVYYKIILTINRPINKMLTSGILLIEKKKKKHSPFLGNYFLRFSHLFYFIQILIRKSIVQFYYSLYKPVNLNALYPIKTEFIYFLSYSILLYILLYWNSQALIMVAGNSSWLQQLAPCCSRSHHEGQEKQNQQFGGQKTMQEGEESNIKSLLYIPALSAKLAKESTMQGPDC